jgi:RimJ/RimL family protein N-acetyltransferase
MAELRFPAPPLAGDAVLLRPWGEADLPAIVLAFSDPVLQRFSWHTTVYTETDAREFFAEQEEARLRGEELTFALVEPRDPDVVLARWAFAELGLARLELTCGPDNEASQQVADRCGFSREGLLRSHVPFKGARRDSVIYSLLPGELRCGRADDRDARQAF